MWPHGDLTEIPNDDPASAAEKEAEQPQQEADTPRPRVEEVDQDGNPIVADSNRADKSKGNKTKKSRPQSKDVVNLFLHRAPAVCLIKSWLDVIRREDCESETYLLTADSIIAFVSDMEEYIM